LNLVSPLVQQRLQERYGVWPPWDEPMIAPGDLFNCLELVMLMEKKASAQRLVRISVVP